ncbi:hypothetical protein G3A43_07065 [Paraburkholderia aspalathi]|nr:hypothetical protein [Paraburkholderia aspalathi]MBK3780012.1 hypothetical protein [Paraburkholderia aspalathi]
MNGLLAFALTNPALIFVPLLGLCAAAGIVQLKKRYVSMAGYPSLPLGADEEPQRMPPLPPRNIDIAHALETVLRLAGELDRKLDAWQDEARQHLNDGKDAGAPLPPQSEASDLALKWNTLARELATNLPRAEYSREWTKIELASEKIAFIRTALGQLLEPGVPYRFRHMGQNVLRASRLSSDALHEFEALVTSLKPYLEWAAARQSSTTVRH